MEPVSLDSLKNLFIEQLDYIKRNGTSIQPSNDDQLDALKTAAYNAKTIDQLGNLIVVPKVNSNAGFKPIDKLTDSVTNYMNLQYDKANMDWYFMFGNCGSFAFTFIIFAIPLCNPDITSKYNLTGNQACIYNISGGYGIKDGSWVSIPHTFCQADYTTSSDNTLFSWNISAKGLRSFTDEGFPLINTASLVSTTPGNFKINVTWFGGYTIQAELSSELQPSLNGPGGCDPCIGGIGTSYYSYTNMKVSNCSVGNIEEKNMLSSTNGVGWFDHQWLQSGMIHVDENYLVNNTLAALVTLRNYFQPQPLTRWFWLTIQDSVNNVQYMVYVYPQDILKLNSNLEFFNGQTVKYTNGSPTYSQDATVNVIETKLIDGIVFPVKHSVEISSDNRTYILEASFGNSIVYLPSGTPNWEGPGTLYDETGTNILGTCFLEANQMSTEKSILTKNTLAAGLQNPDLFNLSNSVPPVSAVVSSFLWLLLLFILAVLILYLIYLLLKLVYIKLTK